MKKKRGISEFTIRSICIRIARERYGIPMNICGYVDMCTSFFPHDLGHLARLSPKDS